MPRVDYSTHVWCTHCGEKRPIIKCKFVVNYGYKCPECGWKCRTKSRYTRNKPYIPTKTKHNIRRQILEQTPGYTRNSTEKKEYDKQYYLNHKEYFKEYMKQYRMVQLAKEKARVE